MRGVFALVALSIIGAALFHMPAYADTSLQLRPLQYQESLQKGEKKKGYIDIINPTPAATKVTLSVQGFRQADSQGNLTFYDDAQLRQGIQLDYQQVQIPAHKTLRLFFVVDSTKLPTGDVFAAIFAQTAASGSGARPSVRLGTLLILTNGTPAVHRAEVTHLALPWWQTGDLHGQMTLKNTAPPQSSNGFFPKVQLTMWPFGPTRTVQAPLIYAGITRTVPFRESVNQVGIYRVTVSYGTSHQAAWVVLLPGVWRGIVPVVMGAIVVGIVLYARYRSRRSRVAFKR